MHILFVSDVYFPRVNGVSTSIRTFRRELEALGHRVWLVAPDYGEAAGADEEWIFRVPARTVPVDPEDRMMSLRGAVALAPRLAGLRIDLVHIQTPFVAHYAGTRLARALGVPLVLSYHTYFEEYLQHYVRFLPAALLRWAVRRLSVSQCGDVDTVVVPTVAFRQVLLEYGVAGEPHVVPTGIDLERFSGGDGARFRAAHGIAPQRPVVLFVGRLVHEKNIGFLLEVVQRLLPGHPELLFLLAGEGPAEPWLRRRGEELGITDHLHFVGNLHSMAELRDCYAAGNVLIFASRTETQGLVVLEAMASGVPVVAFPYLGTRDLLRDGRGCLTATEEVEDFAAKTGRLLADPALCATLAASGRAYVRQWSAAALAGRLVELYRELVEELDEGDEEAAEGSLIPGVEGR